MKITEKSRLKIGSIRIFGNEEIRTYIIRREIPFERGDLFDEQKLAGAEERIRRIPGVDYSEIRVAYTPVDSSLIISTIVTEKPTHDGRLLLRRGYQNKISIGLEVWEANFRGRSERLSGSILLRGNTVAIASWQNPWIGSGIRMGLDARVFYKKYKYAYDDCGVSFAGEKIERIGVDVGTSLPLGENGRARLSAGFESVRGSTPGITLEDDKDAYATTALTIMYDTRESDNYPWDGLYLEARAEEIGPFSDTFSIHEGTADLRLYKSILDRGVLAAHGRIRYRGGGEIPLYRREHIGGSQTLRGYDYGSFHGIHSVITSVEQRIPWSFSKEIPAEDVLLGFSLHVFADAAAAWEQGEDLSIERFHGTYGLGIYAFSKLAYGIRLDYGWRRNGKGRLEIDVGMKF